MDALGEQLQASMALASRYDVALRELPDRADLLRDIRDAHLQHAKAMADLISSATAGGCADGDAATILNGLREMERAALGQASEACLAAPAEQAELFGSIAAALASHQEALR